MFYYLSGVAVQPVYLPTRDFEYKKPPRILVSYKTHIYCVDSTLRSSCQLTYVSQ